MITSEVSFIRSGSSGEMEERSSYENEMYGQRKSADPGTGTGREYGLSFSCEQTVQVHTHSRSGYHTYVRVAHTCERRCECTRIWRAQGIFRDDLALTFARLVFGFTVIHTDILTFPSESSPYFGLLVVQLSCLLPRDPK